MASATQNRLIASIVRLQISAESDGDLLRCFADARDEAAFAMLVQRHGPLVLGVCRRIIPDVHLAEDAFQSVFVVLANKAKSLDKSRPLAPWLYGVASRVALRARTMIGRRRKRETLTAAVPDVPVAPPLHDDVSAIVDEEIGRLSGVCREALVLCELQGVSRKEASAKLGIAEGTLSSRLAAARKALAIRLKRRGVATPLVLASAVSVPPALAKAAVGSSVGVASGVVAQLTQEILRMMLVAKLKLPAVIVAMGMTLTMGFGTVVWSPAPDQAFAAQAPREKPEVPKKLDRVPDPSPELRRELAQFDEKYRHGTPEMFAELEALADELAKKYPARDDRARIWYEVAHVAAQSGVDKQAGRVRKYAAKCLKISRDPLQRGCLYTYLACTEDLSGHAFAKGRRKAAEILFTGYLELLAQDLPEKAPELPIVNKIGGEIGIDPAAEALARARQAALMAARVQAEFIRDQVGQRNTFVMQFRDLYKPTPNYHGRGWDGPAELGALAQKRLPNRREVDLFMERVLREK